jgi:hypothetical protein
MLDLGVQLFMGGQSSSGNLSLTDIDKLELCPYSKSSHQWASLERSWELTNHKVVIWLIPLN